MPAWTDTSWSCGQGCTVADAEADWLAELRRQCGLTSQARVAKVLGLSSATISLVLKGTYSGSLANVETRVRGAFLGSVVDCPILGEISSHVCQQNQRLKFAATSPQRVALYRACRNCEHSSFPKEE